MFEKIQLISGVNQERIYEAGLDSQPYIVKHPFCNLQYLYYVLMWMKKFTAHSSAPLLRFLSKKRILFSGVSSPWMPICEVRNVARQQNEACPSEHDPVSYFQMQKL